MGDKFIFEKAEEILFIQVCGLWKTKTMAKLELLLIRRPFEREMKMV